MKFQKRCVSLYFYFAYLKEENEIPLSPLTSSEHEILYKEGNLGKPIAPLDSWHDYLCKLPYLDCRCPPLIHLEFSSPAG